MPDHQNINNFKPKRKRLAANAAALTLALGALAAGNASAAQLPLNGTLALKDAAVEQAVSVSANSKDSYFGSSVANIGDFNGDGKTDYAVGEPRYSGKGTTQGGAVRIILGGDSLKSDYTVEQGGASILVFNSADTYKDHYGASVAKAGDINGDGLADLIFGAPDANTEVDSESKVEASKGESTKVSGRAYVVFGRTAGGDIDVAGEFGGYRIDGEAHGDAAGVSVGTIADLNGDDRPEVIVGAEKSDPGQREDAGSVYVLFGKSDSAAITLGAGVVDNGQGIRIDGPQGGKAGGAYLGRSVDSINDLNGDGKPELLLTAPRAGNGSFANMPVGNAYVVWGVGTAQTIDLEYVNERNFGYRITGSLSKAGAGSERSTNGDFLGQSIAQIGDVNADGKPDFAIGAHLTDINDRLNPGRVWVIYGKSDGENINLDKLDKGGFAITGIDEQDQAGYDVSAAGDYNADGIDDLVVASPYADPVSVEGAGAAYVVWGSKGAQSDLDLAEFGQRATRISGPNSKSALGVSVTNAGDVNGDGGADLLIGAPGGIYDTAYNVTGEIWFTFGAKSKDDGVLQDPAASDPGYEETIKLDGCRPKYNTQALVIDDGYIDDLDPKRYRGLALETYAAKPRNAGTVFGVTAFPDDDPEPIFEPLVLGEAKVDPVSKLRKEIDGDDGFPGWAGLLASAAKDNPSAQARIYAMDGVGFKYVDKLEGFTEGAPPSYVVAVGHEYEKSDAKAMKRFATETGGKYYAVDSGVGVTKAVNAIESRLRCDIDREQFQQVLHDEDSEDVNVVGLEDGTHSVDIVASWAGDWRDRFEVDDIEVLRNTDDDEELEVVQDFDSEEIDDAFAAKASAKGSKKLSGVKRRGLRALHLTGLKKGKLRVKVKATKLHGAGRVLTQVSQSRFRK